jgi:hypothetical protein
LSKSIGFLLLLWVGIFLPVTEYQVSHVGSIGSLIGFSADTAATTDADDSQSNKKMSKNDRYTASLNLDLSDFTLVVGLPQLSLSSASLIARRLREDFVSRELPPEDRPPIALAA